MGSAAWLAAAFVQSFRMRQTLVISWGKKRFAEERLPGRKVLPGGPVAIELGCICSLDEQNGHRMTVTFDSECPVPKRWLHDTETNPAKLWPISQRYSTWNPRLWRYHQYPWKASP